MKKTEIKYKQKKQNRESARDVGLHAPTSLELKRNKKRFSKDLSAFLRFFFALMFFRPFSKDQKKFIREIEETVLKGGQYVIAMPRGEGKTTILIGAIIWAILYGHRKYIVIVGADQAAANKILESIRITLSVNEKLNDYFPEACHYIKALGNLAQRAAGQLANGEPTHIQWRTEHIVFAQVPPQDDMENCFSAVLEACGITGGIRGLNQTLADGRMVRPDLVLMDDPQTRESAKSYQQTQDRLTIIRNDIGGLSGIGTDAVAAMLMACTVIEEGDLSDIVISEWRGIRAKSLYKYPDEKDGLWQEYIQFRKKVKLERDPQKECNAFYRKNRKAMDKGAEVGNPHRKNKGDLSALQTCYNFISDNGQDAFNAEWQNDPTNTLSTVYDISPKIVEKKFNNFERLFIPPDCHYINLGIDINFYALNWAISAVQNDMAAYCIDYGQYPKGRPLWEQGSKITAEQAIYDGLIELVNAVHARNPMLKMVGIDGNYATDTVYRVVAHLDKILPIRVLVMRGVASDKYSLPMDRKKLINEGYECFLRNSDRGHYIVFNSHFWHSHLQKAFFLNPGFAGSYSLFGDANTDHSVIASHICADRLVDVSGKSGKQIYTWTRRPSERNDLADALVMSLVPASIFGADVTAGKVQQQVKAENKELNRNRVTYINI